MSFSANWYCSTEIDADWDLRATGWHVEVEGDTPLDVDIRSPVPAERWPEVLSQPDGAPSGQRDSLRLCRRAGDSYHHQSTEIIADLSEPAARG